MVRQIDDLVTVDDSFYAHGLRNGPPPLGSQVHEAPAELFMDLPVDVSHAKGHAAQRTQDLPSLDSLNRSRLARARGVEVVVLAGLGGTHHAVEATHVVDARKLQLSVQNLHQLALKVLRRLPFDEADRGVLLCIG